MTEIVENPALPRWWQTRWAVALLSLATALPIAFAAIPPLVDLYGHLGRYHIQAEIADNPLIQQNWAFRWALVANLGVDLLSIPLGALFGLERAIWLIVLAIPPLMAFGFFRVARQVHADIPATALAALPLALAYPFQFGFVNYWLGTALAFHVFASWLARSETGATARRTALFVPAGLIVWITHVYAWGILGVLAGGSEIGRAWQRGERGIDGLFWRPFVKTLPLAAPLPLMILWRVEGTGAITEGWFNFAYKVSGLIYALRDQSIVLDLLSLALLLTLIYAAFRHPALRISPLLGVPAALLFALTMIFPYQLFGSAYAVTRLWPVAIAVMILAIRPVEGREKLARHIALFAVVLFAVRIAAGAIGYAAYDRDHGRHLEALNEIESGARVAAFVQLRCSQPWRRARLEQLASLAILRRDAFANTQWDVPGAQLLEPLAAADTRFNADPSQFVWDENCPDDLRPQFYRRLAQLPRHRFDYVWIIDFDPTSLRMPADLEPIYVDERTALYRITESTAS